MKKFTEIWLLSIPAKTEDGESPKPQCLFAKEILTGKTIEKYDLTLEKPPFDVGAGSLIITCNASEILGCFIYLHWPRPANLIDLGVEARNLRNGLVEKDDCRLTSALQYYGFPTVAECISEEIDKKMIFAENNVAKLSTLYKEIEKEIDLPRALFRGRYMYSVAVMERNGIPLDKYKLQQILANRTDLRNIIIDEIIPDFPVYKNYKFSRELFAKYLLENRMSWPRNDSGELDMTNDAFDEMSKSYPHLEKLMDTRKLLQNLNKNSLVIGKDSRNRSPLVPFKSKTGRNQPTGKCIFISSKVLRSLIKPAEGNAIAYIDWCQQEFAIAAALSDDNNMKKAYLSGDPYLTFAVQVGAAPSMATKESSPEVRSLFKECTLAVQYGMGVRSLSKRINRSEAESQSLLNYHKNNFNKFWYWSDQQIEYIMINNILKTELGWQISIKGQREINERSLRNFPMQANGAEILRVACILATEAGIKVCAPVHDALLIESPIDDIENEVKKTQAFMQQAGEFILDGFQLRTDVEIFKYPERYVDEKGYVVWQKINRYLEENNCKSCV